MKIILTISVMALLFCVINAPLPIVLGLALAVGMVYFLRNRFLNIAERIYE